MSRPNTAYVEPRERGDDQPNLPSAPMPMLPAGVELLIFELGSSLQDGQAAYADLIAARDAGDKIALRASASRLVIALGSDPKALARKIALMVKP